MRSPPCTKAGNLTPTPPKYCSSAIKTPLPWPNSKDIDQFFADQRGFTYSQTLAFAAPRDTKIDTSGGILRYHYTLPLKTPVRGVAQFKIYENSYYMDVTYAADQTKQWDNGCRLTIKEAKPTAEEEELAASFDQNAQAPTGLGAVFAQTSELQCGE